MAASGPGRPARVPLVGERVYWIGDARHPRREGTVTAVYAELRGGVETLVVDLRWDRPGRDDARPWGGLSRGIPAVRLTEPGWGWITPARADALNGPRPTSDEIEEASALQRALGRTVRQLRAAAGYSQEDFAHAFGANRTYVGAVERGEKNIALRTLHRLATALGVSVTALLTQAERVAATGVDRIAE